MKIAIIEDEQDLLEMLEFTLQNEGFDAIGFLNTENAYKFIYEETPDLLIVDRNLPNIDGLDFVKKLYKEGFSIPTIFVTAKVSDEDVLDGFEVGAEDYIRKPFNIKELLARINVVLKRNNKVNNVLSYKDMQLDIRNRILYKDGIGFQLTKAETNVLIIFFKHSYHVVSREELIEELHLNNEKSINVLINRIQHKIGNIFEAVRGIGYRLK